MSRGRDLLAHGGDLNAVIALAYDEGFPFLQCVRLLTRLGVSLAEAKPLVHNSPLYAESKQDREDFWEDLAEATHELAEPSQTRLTEATGVQQRSTGTDDAQPDQHEPHHIT